jgi:hypothetical protein
MALGSVEGRFRVRAVLSIGVPVHTVEDGEQAVGRV